MKRFMCLGLLLCAALIVGCNKKDSTTTGPTASATDTNVPTFVLGYSEYPSSSVFGVAQDKGWIGGSKDKLGVLEKKWGVKIVIKEVDYDTLVTMYGAGQADAVCIVGFDTLASSLSRDAVNIIPVSTSNGGDAVVVTGINSIDDLKGKTTYGLEKSVSQYLFERVLSNQGRNLSDYPYKNLDPSAAATAMQTKQGNIDSITVWNPFIMQTLRTRTDSKVLFDSSAIPQEIVDVVVAGKDSLKKPGGDRFAALVCDTFYTFNQHLAKSAEADDLTVALGAKFSSLPLKDMQDVLTKTVFYKTPEDALKLLASDQFRNKTMPTVSKFCQDHGMLTSPATVGFDDDNAKVNFSTKYIKMAQEKGIGTP